MPRSFRFSIAAAALLTISSGSLFAGAPATPRTASAASAKKVGCKYYSNYVITGSTVICFGPPGNACAVCQL